jgi:hypothetical protein
MRQGRIETRGTIARIHTEELEGLRFRHLFQFVLSILVICSCAAAAPAGAEPASPEGEFDLMEFLRNVPVVHRFVPLPIPASELSRNSSCPVMPLPVIEDVEALEFENRTSPDTKGLLPAMARALEKFEQLVMSAGGSVEIKSAYRPEAYQAHLQEVWYKWKELRYNRQPGCQALRAEVTEEFARHNLLATQKPVTSSDHTRGMAFDAAVFMPRAAVKKKHRVSVDRLCRQAGIQRPDVRRDPVHFKLGMATPVATSVARRRG